MNTWLSIFLIILLFPLIYTGLLYLKNREKNGDIPGSEEDGFLGRFPGAIIEYYRYEENVHRLVVAPPVLQDSGQLDFELLEIRGKRKTLLYKLPIQNDAFPVFEYYRREMERAGFSILYSGFGTGLPGDPGQWYRQVFISSRNLFVWADLSSMLTGRLHCYLSGECESGNEKVYLSVFAVNHFRNDKKTAVFIFVSRK